MIEALKGAGVAAAVILAAMSVASGQGATPERPTFVPPPAKEGFVYPDCYCTDSEGQRVEIGERACLRIGSREVTARCDMSLNNPTWRTEGDGCPLS